MRRLLCRIGIHSFEKIDTKTIVTVTPGPWLSPPLKMRVYVDRCSCGAETEPYVMAPMLGHLRARFWDDEA